MSQQKPPESRGKVSGFPYSILWEEFGTILDALDEKPDAVGRAEALFATLSPVEQKGLRFPTAAMVDELVRSFGAELGARDPKALSLRLYAIAATHFLPKIKAAAGQDIKTSRARLQRIAKTAGQLSRLLGETNTQLSVALSFIRKAMISETAAPLFDFESLRLELDDLARSAKACVSELPRLPRGRTVNVHHARLMEAVTAAIGDASTVEIELKQSNTEGRNPRPDSVSARLLFDYLSLVEPAMTDAEKERLFAKFSRAGATVTLREMEERGPDGNKDYRMPRKWRRRTGRNDLIRDMYPK